MHSDPVTWRGQRKIGGRGCICGVQCCGVQGGFWHYQFESEGIEVFEAWVRKQNYCLQSNKITFSPPLLAR
jgi:hypothetical protein